MCNPAMSEFELAILSVRATERPIHGDAIGYGRHGKDPIADGPDAIVILGQSADRIATRVGGVIPRAIVVDGPVHELQVAIRTHCINIEEIRQRKLSDAEFDPAQGYAGSECKEARLLVGSLIRQA